ncbi:hypothetical protein MASR1M45_27690 [Candidatus Kapaibacterium sp.]
MEQIAEPLIRRRAIRHLEKNQLITFGAGTDSCYDTAAGNEAIKVKLRLSSNNQVDDASSDPEKNPNAVKFDTITYRQVLEKDLRVMDHTAITLCHENNLPMSVININQKGNLRKLIMGENIGTLISDK